MTIGQLILTIISVAILLNQTFYYLYEDNKFDAFTVDNSTWALITFMFWVLIATVIAIGTPMLIIYTWHNPV